jgi:cysteine synthase A
MVSHRIITAAALGGGLIALFVDRIIRRLRRPRERDMSGFEQLVGNTPLVKLRKLSQLLGCEIYGKAEFMNPGGSVKDRVALAIIKSLPDNSVVYEGTSGSTGISLTLAARAKGHDSVIFMPDDQAREKQELITSLGARLELVRPMSIIDPSHMCKSAERASKTDPRGVYADQFENKLNFKAHFEGTAVEIINQTNKRVNVFVASSGTGGTMAGVSCRLKLDLGRDRIKCFLADPQGSALGTRINHGTLFNVKDKEGYRVRHPFDTVTEGIGLNRLTQNFQIGIPFIDKGFEISDLEAVKMSRYLLDTEGLFLGSSSAVNCAAIVKAWKGGHIKAGDVVVTILCDSGTRHVSKFWNDQYLEPLGLRIERRDCADPISFITS